MERQGDGHREASLRDARRVQGRVQGPQAGQAQGAPERPRSDRRRGLGRHEPRLQGRARVHVWCPAQHPRRRKRPEGERTSRLCSCQATCTGSNYSSPGKRRTSDAPGSWAPAPLPTVSRQVQLQHTQRSGQPLHARAASRVHHRRARRARRRAPRRTPVPPPSRPPTPTRRRTPPQPPPRRCALGPMQIKALSPSPKPAAPCLHPWRVCCPWCIAQEGAAPPAAPAMAPEMSLAQMAVPAALLSPSMVKRPLGFCMSLHEGFGGGAPPALYVCRMVARHRSRAESCACRRRPQLKRARLARCAWLALQVATPRVAKTDAQTQTDAPPPAITAVRLSHTLSPCPSPPNNAHAAIAAAEASDRSALQTAHCVTQAVVHAADEIQVRGLAGGPQRNAWCDVTLPVRG